MNTKHMAMVLATLKLLSKPTKVHFGPDEDAAAAAAAAKAAEEKAAADKAAADAAAAKAKTAKTYTQQEFDNLSAAQRRSYQKEMEKQAAELNKLAEDKRLTQEERDTYAKKAEELEAQYKTQAQLAEERQKKMEEEHKKSIKKTSEERDTYKRKYEDTLIDNALTQAAAEADEQIPGQLKKFLRQDTVLQDEIVEGKLTGVQIVMVNLEDTDKEGKPTKLVLPVKEAVKRMKEIPERFGNFFKGVGSPGVGAGNGRGGGGNAGAMPTDTAAYMAARKANK